MAIDNNEAQRLQRETNDALSRLVLELRESRPSTTSSTSRTDTGSQDTQALQDVNDALGRTTGAIQQLTDGLGTNASALRSAAEAFTSGGQGLLGALTSGLSDGGGLSSFLSSGFGLAPVANALIGLFRGGNDQPAQPVFNPAPPPASINLEGALGGRGITSVTRGANSVARVAPAQAAGPQVVVNVSAMDSQSFLTRSHDIARAVRDAMLHMDPLNDVIGEL
ncbi:MAG: hypothetical protein R2724_21645 [Bryobacterales bacterium]